MSLPNSNEDILNSPYVHFHRFVWQNTIDKIKRDALINKIVKLDLDKKISLVQ